MPSPEKEASEKELEDARRIAHALVGPPKPRRGLSQIREEARERSLSDKLHEVTSTPSFKVKAEKVRKDIMREVNEYAKIHGCQIDGCGRKDIESRGMCKTHYQRWWYEQRKKGIKLSNRKSQKRRSIVPKKGKPYWQRGPLARNKTGYKGVVVANAPGKPTMYQAKATFNGKDVFLGQFYKAEEAARAYDDFAAQVFKNPYLNFPAEHGAIAGQPVT